jgi:hypothetical protein
MFQCEVGLMDKVMNSKYSIPVPSFRDDGNLEDKKEDVDLDVVVCAM